MLKNFDNISRNISHSLHKFFSTFLKKIFQIFKTLFETFLGNIFNIFRNGSSRKCPKYSSKYSKIFRNYYRTAMIIKAEPHIRQFLENRRERWARIGEQVMCRLVYSYILAIRHYAPNTFLALPNFWKI